MPMIRRKGTRLFFGKILVYAGPAPRPGLFKELDARVAGTTPE
jgi:hypothetical protein